MERKRLYISGMREEEKEDDDDIVKEAETIVPYAVLSSTFMVALIFCGGES